MNCTNRVLNSINIHRTVKQNRSFSVSKEEIGITHDGDDYFLCRDVITPPVRTKEVRKNHMHSPLTPGLSREVQAALNYTINSRNQTVRDDTEQLFKYANELISPKRELKKKKIVCPSVEKLPISASVLNKQRKLNITLQIKEEILKKQKYEYTNSLQTQFECLDRTQVKERQLVETLMDCVNNHHLCKMKKLERNKTQLQDHYNTILNRTKRRDMNETYTYDPFKSDLDALYARF